MFDFDFHDRSDKPELYSQLEEFARGLLAGESDRIANMANLSALIFQGLPDLNWAGFYLAADDELVVGPFQGKPACIRIPLGRGVCGKAAADRETLMVDDVHAFEGHIACDADTRSEIVVPVVHADRLIGVLDLDSPAPARFDQEDRKGLERIVAVLVETLD